MDSGYIKLHRSVLKWEWYQDVPVSRLWMYLLLSANYADKRWQGVEIKRGQLITSRQKLAEETGLTVQQVRSAINKLISTNEITTKTTNRFTLITIVKYGYYQDMAMEDNQQNNQQSNKRRTNKQPTDNQQITTTKESKEGKKDKKDNNPPISPLKQKYAEAVSMTNDEYMSLIDRFGEPSTKRMIEILDNYKVAKGKSYKSDYRAILSWVVDRLKEEQAKKGKAPRKELPAEYRFGRS
ncbi:MAG: hypothetical protein ACOX8Q_01815 [Christensenellales bacterium]|jgi:hypothetical protein